MKKYFFLLILPLVLGLMLHETAYASDRKPNTYKIPVHRIDADGDWAGVTIEEKKGGCIFENDSTRYVTYNCNMIKYQQGEDDVLGAGIYCDDTFDYCVFTASDALSLDSVYNTDEYVLMVSNQPLDFYELRDGEYAGFGRGSRTSFAINDLSYVGSDGKTYYYYVCLFRTYDLNTSFWYQTNKNDWNTIEPKKKPDVLHFLTSKKDVQDYYESNLNTFSAGSFAPWVIESLITGDFTNVRIDAGDSDNPDVNKPGGLPGSEDNPELD
ncbi:MAG: hypothetical protein NC347_15560, partial [Clostridium sp.]|nr:hypothetical protein [Clostridium sp.]